MAKIKVIKGHLTATDRAAVRFMLEETVMGAKTPRRRYELHQTADGPWAFTGHFDVLVFENRKSESTGLMEERRTTAKIKVTA